ncbi:signal peptidase [Flavihumibacter sp. R14]|nr:signal peptidase [Flavihumibacter soli]
MNKYMKRGFLLVIAGVALILLGYYLKDTELMKYGWAMIIGYLAFGAGVLYIIYSLIRKIDRSALLEERAEKEEEEERHNGRPDLP